MTQERAKRPNRTVAAEGVVTSIRLMPDELEFIRGVAESQQRSVSAQIRFMIAQMRRAEAQAA